MTTEERVKKLERENRWMKVAGGALVLGLLVVLFGGAGQDQAKPKVADEIRAKKFILIDDVGKERGRFESVFDKTRIELRGKDGKCFFGVTGDGTTGNLTLRDGAQGGVVVSLVASEGGATLYVFGTGDPELRKPRMGFRFFEDSSHVFFVCGKDGKPQVVLGSQDDGPAGLGQNLMRTKFELRKSDNEVLIELKE